jgi:hypothetical protein
MTPSRARNASATTGAVHPCAKMRHGSEGEGTVAYLGLILPQTIGARHVRGSTIGICSRDPHHHQEDPSWLA